MTWTSQFEHQFIASRSRRGLSRPKLMVVLHGRGDSLKSFRKIGEELGLPQFDYLLLNAPRRYDGGHTWYGFPPNQKLGILNARKKLTRLMDELEHQGYQSTDVFFFGFSQGCLVSLDFAANYSKPLGGVIAVSGYVYFFPKWKQKLTEAAFKTPCLVTHGTEDEALPIEETRSQVKRLIAAGLPIEWMEFKKDHEFDYDRELPLIRHWALEKAGYIRPIKRAKVKGSKSAPSSRAGELSF